MSLLGFRRRVNSTGVDRYFGAMSTVGNSLYAEGIIDET